MTWEERLEALITLEDAYPKLGTTTVGLIKCLFLDRVSRARGGFRDVGRWGCEVS